MTDEQLLKDFLAGDECALAKLVEKYLKPIYSFIYQLTHDKSASQDITQDVFVKMWKSADSFDVERKFSTWLYAIAKNTTYDCLKKKKALPFAAFENSAGINILENIEDEVSLHSEAMLQKMDDVEDARKFLESLSPELRTIFSMHHQQGFTLAEIAEILGTPSNTIKSKYRRALLSLRNTYSSKKSNIESAPETLPVS